VAGEMKKATIEIDGRAIGEGVPPYLIAELSANHNGALDRALEIMESAKKAGADAIKIQTYTADTLTIDSDGPDFRITGGLWDGYSLYKLYEEAHTPWAWHEALFAKAKALEITMFSSPFDETAVDFLEELGCPAYKIASFELVDHALIAKAASTGKPMIMSTGMADEEEIGEALSVARKNGCEELVLLHCVSGYPTPAEDANLATISDMAAKFGVPIGLSDHTLGSAVALGAVALGACVIEKHFTNSRADGGPDSEFSAEPLEFGALVQDARMAWSAVGNVSYERKESEKSNAVFRRSIYAVQDIAAGDKLTVENLRVIRPGHGLKPKFLDELIGRNAKVSISRGTAMDWDLVE